MVVLPGNKQTPLLSDAEGSTVLTQCSVLDGVSTICDAVSTVGERWGRAKAPTDPIADRFGPWITTQLDAGESLTAAP
jgi:hypothetical protein